jgi:hypothetical protein
MDVAGKDPQPMTPLSETTFSGTRLDFVKNDQSVVTHLLIHVVEGDLKAVRQADASTEKRQSDGILIAVIERGSISCRDVRVRICPLTATTSVIHT